MFSQEGFSLIEPFIVCASKDGPYDDDAFVAGVRYGQFTQWLEGLNTLTAQGRIEFPLPFPTPLAPQIDLAAMRLGWQSIAVADPEQSEWTWIALERICQSSACELD